MRRSEEKDFQVASPTECFGDLHREEEDLPRLCREKETQRAILEEW